MALVKAHNDSQQVAAAITPRALDLDQYFNLLTGLMPDQAVTLANDLLLGARLRGTSAAPTVGSGGTGVSALTMVSGSSNLAGGVNATLTAIAAGVVVGVVAFSSAQATAPLFVICSLAAPIAGVAAPPVVGADSYSTNGFTIRSYGPTTVTTGAYVINYVAFF